MKRRPTVLIKHDDIEAWIDQEIAGLVLGLWKLGLRTIHSCQGESAEKRNKGYLTFPNVPDGQAFLSLIVRHNPNSSSQIRFYGAPTKKDKWDIEYIIKGDGDMTFDYQTNKIREMKNGDLSFSLIVRFPYDDISMMTECVEHELNGS